VPITSLRSEPFNLAFGSSIYAKVLAFNIYGDSLMSAEGNGAIILTVPNPPVSLSEVYSERTATSIGISWSDGALNGGATVLDYTVSYDQGLDSYVVLKSGVLTQSFTATGLKPGVTYSFKVQARNTFGLSVESSRIELVCAFIPAIP